MTIDSVEVFRNAVTFYQTGHYDEAEELSRSVLQKLPQHTGAKHLLGMKALRQGGAEQALPYLQAAWEAEPAESAYWESFGECQLALGRFKEVASLVGQAIKQGKSSPQLLELRVRAKRGVGKKEPPAALKEEVLALFRAQRAGELEPRARATLAQYPGWVLGWSALGAALSMTGKNAEMPMRRALQLAPQSAEAHNNLGVHLREKGRIRESLEHFRKAMKFRPAYAEAHFNLGAALCELGQHQEAKGCFDKAILLKPNYVEAIVEQSMALFSLGQELAAQESLRRALQLNPSNAKAYTNLLFSLLHRGDVKADQIFAEHRRFGEQFETGLPEAAPFGNTREVNRCLQVGIVSGDFRNHAVASFLEPVLSHLAGSSRLSLHAYSNYGVVDAVTNRLKGYCAHWNDIAGLSDEDLVQKMRADGIDILIDLSGHTAHNRLLTFARRAAPVQVSWIGYPGTTGLQAMDYYFGDRHYLPPGQFDRYFTEKIVRLPANIPFLPSQVAPAVNELPALRNGYVTFGSFNRINKINQQAVALWSRLLRDLSESRMVLAGMPENQEPGALLSWFEAEGIARERLEVYPRSDMAAYLMLHHRVDICLDTFPYNGGTTTCHAAWMGVPTLTQSGSTVTSRVAAAFLGHLGLEEFAAQDADEFVCKGLDWSGRLGDLAQLRAGMRERFANSPLGRPDMIASALEQAFRIMWQRWCEGLSAESFEVDGASAPDTAELLRRSGELYLAGQLEEAEAVCRSILQAEPGHSDANYNLGLMALERGQADRAMPYLHAAWEAVPTEGQFWLTLGECLLAMEHFAEAQALAEEAVRHGFDVPEISQIRLRALGGLGMMPAGDADG